MNQAEFIDQDALSVPFSLAPSYPVGLNTNYQTMYNTPPQTYRADMTAYPASPLPSPYDTLPASMIQPRSHSPYDDDKCRCKACKDRCYVTPYLIVIGALILAIIYLTSASNRM
jgi:hypothetical protein